MEAARGGRERVSRRESTGPGAIIKVSIPALCKTTSAFAVRASTTSRTFRFRFRTTSSRWSPAFPGPANRRWPSTRSMPRASGATWNRSPLMRASFWSAWRSRTSRISTASRRRSPSGRKTPAAIRAPRSPLPPRCYDFLRLLYARVGQTFCPTCGGRVRRDSVDEVAARLLALPAGSRWYALFAVGEHAGAQALRDHLFELRKKGFNRLYQGGAPVRILHAGIAAGYRFREARLHPGGSHRDWPGSAPAPGGHHRDLLSRGRRSRSSKAPPADEQHPLQREDSSARPAALEFTPPEPILFSFNSPFGACPRCQGFGNTIDFDMDRVIPDKSLSLDEGAVDPWTKPKYRSWLGNFKKSVKAVRFRRSVLRVDRTASARPTYEFIRRFFDHLETKKYKMHVRVFLSRYRGYALCPECKGARLRKEALYVRVGGKNLAEVVRMNIAEAQRFFLSLELSPEETRHRRQDPGRDPAAAEVPERRRPGLSHARSAVLDAFGRRSAAHPTRHVPGLAPGGRMLRARRAVDRPAQPRHRPPDPHSRRAARAGQHDRGGGARSRRDARGRPHRRPGSRRGRARRQHRFRRRVSRS